MRALEFIVLPYALSGFGVGFVVGLTGVGGGSLMTPLLVLLFGFHRLQRSAPIYSTPRSPSPAELRSITSDRRLSGG